MKRLQQSLSSSSGNNRASEATTINSTSFEFCCLDKAISFTKFVSLRVILILVNFFSTICSWLFSLPSSSSQRLSAPNLAVVLFVRTPARYVSCKIQNCQNRVRLILRIVDKSREFQGNPLLGPTCQVFFLKNLCFCRLTSSATVAEMILASFKIYIWEQIDSTLN